MIVNNNDFEILTPNGWEDFKGVQKLNKPQKVTLYSKVKDEELKLECSDTHRVKTPKG